ncbi:hypothetical protein CASFOL_021525 [Castilleja foliolosa]|uniref:Uncharacterized protein n=1 Tax=Castilleja foliolosa TaxID=1961234 RepID=A0ABD3CYU2_9LAMI
MIPKFQDQNKPFAKHFMAPTISAPSKATPPRNKILSERNENSLNSDFQIPKPEKKKYDPLTNYLSPRPKNLPSSAFDPSVLRPPPTLIGEQDQLAQKMKPITVSILNFGGGFRSTAATGMSSRVAREASIRNSRRLRLTRLMIGEKIRDRLWVVGLREGKGEKEEVFLQIRSLERMRLIIGHLRRVLCLQSLGDMRGEEGGFGIESSNGGANPDNWVKRKDDEG